MKNVATFENICAIVVIVLICVSWLLNKLFPPETGEKRPTLDRFER